MLWRLLGCYPQRGEEPEAGSRTTPPRGLSHARTEKIQSWWSYDDNEAARRSAREEHEWDSLTEMSAVLKEVCALCP